MNSKVAFRDDSKSGFIGWWDLEFVPSRMCFTNLMMTRVLCTTLDTQLLCF